MKTTKHQSSASKIEVARIVAIHEANHRKNTQDVNHALLQQMEAYAGHPLCVAEVTEGFCTGFAVFLMTRVSANSARTYLNKLHAVMEHAVALHLLRANPMPDLRALLPRRTGTQRTYLSREELDRLAATPCRHGETKRAFLFACHTGLRLSDIETLCWSDIREVEGRPTIVKTQVKTGQQVRVPLTRRALALLRQETGGERVFDLMSRAMISLDLKRWARDAGLDKNLTFHVSRHTFASLSVAAGVDIYVVSKLCGHSTVRTTEIYAHMQDSTLQNGIQRLDRTLTPSRLQRTDAWLSRLVGRTGFLLRKLRQ